jgi:hypothetical protein
MANTEQSSKASASRAGKVLRDPKASAAAKSAAASTLTQRASLLEQTGKAAARAASSVMRDPKASPAEKSAAASALTQRANRKRR